MAPRPRLKPAFQPVRRGAGTVQLGSTPESGGVLLAGLDASEVGLLERLDGSLTEPALYALAAGWGVPRSRAVELLELLKEQGLLVDRPGPTPSLLPERQYVLVAGTGQLADEIATLLRRDGVGRVAAGSWAADLAEAELRAALTPWRGDPVDSGPHLVVAVSDEDGLDVRAALAWRDLGVPVLPVVASTGRVVVGPLVGDDPGEACLGCLALTRAESEPGLAARDVDADRPTVALAALAAGAVAMLVHAVLTADPVPPGVSVEASLPWPRLDHRRWQRHPACDAHDDPADQARASR